jgi:hypothetical protein
MAMGSQHDNSSRAAPLARCGPFVQQSQFLQVQGLQRQALVVLGVLQPQPQAFSSVVLVMVVLLARLWAHPL